MKRRERARGWMVIVIVAALLPVWPSAAGADGCVEFQELRSHSRLVHREIDGVPVNILLPVGYEQSTRRYPVLYLLHGFVFHGAEAWANDSDLIAFTEELTADRSAIVVMPGGDWMGFRVDWRNGAHKPDTFMTETLIPTIDRDYRTLAGRSHRSVAGLSGGGYGALHLAARHPDLFGLVGSFSGTGDVVDLSGPAMAPAEAGAIGGYEIVCRNGRLEPLPFCGGSELCWRNHNAGDLAPNLRSVSTYVAVGSGVPCDAEDIQTMTQTSRPEYLGPYNVEAAARLSNERLHQRLDAAGVEHSYLARPCGIHSWRYWNEDVRNIWDALLTEHAAPASFDYRSADPSFSVWGWTFTADAGRAPEFLDVTQASCSGLQLRGSGVASVRTAPCYGPGQRLALTGGGPPRVVTADALGRLNFTVGLGPAHGNEQYSLLARAAEAQGGYWITSVVTIRPSDDEHLGVSVLPMPLPDVNGDGAQDVVTFEGVGAVLNNLTYGLNGPLSVAVRRGTDGTVFWRTSIQGFGLVQPTRMNGRLVKVDGARWFDWGPPHAETQRVSLLNARTGATVWEAKFEATFYDHSEIGRDEWGKRGVVTFVEDMPDATGDGRRDLFVVTSDYTSTREGIDPAVTSWNLRFTQRGTVLDGRNGVEVGSVEAEGYYLTDPTMARLIDACADLDGDGLSDLVARTGGEDNPTLIASTARGVELWRAPVASGLSTAFSTDLTGDGRNDVVLGADPFLSSGAEAHDGVDGSLLWRHEGNGQAAGDANGDGATDFRVRVFTDADYVISMISGRTGNALWSSTLPSSDQLHVNCCFNADQDLDGDGVLDTLVDYSNYSDPDLATFRTEARSGRDGSVLWSTTLFGSQNSHALLALSRLFPEPFRRLVAADLNGDRAGDLLHVESWNDEPHLVARSGADLSILWEYPFLLGVEDQAFAANLRPEPGRELVVIRPGGREAFAATEAGAFWRIAE